VKAVYHTERHAILDIYIRAKARLHCHDVIYERPNIKLKGKKDKMKRNPYKFVITYLFFISVLLKDLTLEKEKLVPLDTIMITSKK
jgi:hypothetical protein